MHLTGVDVKYRLSIRCKTIFKREMRIIMSDNKKRIEQMINSNEISKKECYCVENEGVPLIKFHCLDEYGFVTLAFSTRFGGVSGGEYLSSLNFGWDRGDDDANVKENYKRMCKELKADYKKLVLSDQVHEEKVEYVDEQYTAGEEIKKKLKMTDGMVTDKKGLVLATSYADCVPLFFVDTKNKAIGSSHSGWRGTVAQIGRKTVEKMKKCFGTDAKDLICIIGPSICQNCYEVSRDVAVEFEKVFKKDTERVLKRNPGTADKYLLNLWEANRIILEKTGVPSENIHVSGLCTCCNPDILYSHRASGGKRGNLNGFIMLED